MKPTKVPKEQSKQQNTNMVNKNNNIMIDTLKLNQILYT